ncbi:MAG: L-alanine-DL-glutamate epimerase [Pirellulales bacterium]|nr:L-alanine-DL-glutamate epimerase [Pirellulales bacterium]
MRIVKAVSDFEREPLKSPFGFKGGYLSELWQTIVRLEDGKKLQGIGVGVQSVLWSDAGVFAENTEAGGNSIMYLMTDFAAKRAVGLDWETPLDLLEQLLPATYEYGKAISARPHLRLTFALNALVAVDNAAWLLYAADKGITDFDTMVPQAFRPALGERHDRLASIPLMSYGVPIDQIVRAVDDGYFFLKIKVGADPDKDGNLDKMLEWDKKRLTEIHRAIGSRTTPYTENGKIVYYLDANGRYDTIERVMRLLDHADKIGALDNILLFEEPFPEEVKVDVSRLPVIIAADESAHSDHDALERISLGYKAIAIKPIAKTMSMSLKIILAAHEKKIPCFCADLTVNPVLVDWNKNVASRIVRLPRMKIGVVETNGRQNYTNWEKMRTYHPCHEAPWTEAVEGIFHLDDDFYRRSGCIFQIGKHYRDLVSPKS